MCGRKHCMDELSIRGPSVARYWNGRTCTLEKNRLHAGEIKDQVRRNGEAGPKPDSLRLSAASEQKRKKEDEVTHNPELSGGGPLGNESTEGRPRRPLKRPGSVHRHFAAFKSASMKALPRSTTDS